jgi:hypothetical protein
VHVTGSYEVGLVDERTGVWTPLFSRENLLPYSWGFIAAKCIGMGDVSYKASAIYLEYENVADPDDVVTIPAYDRTSDLSYYNGLSGNKDFLRVALAGVPTLDIATGYESYFTSGVSGNRVTYTAQSVGSYGVLGRAWSEASNSKAYGVAVVATPVPSDRSQDVILSRGYFAEEDQLLKATGQQVQVRWKHTFN